MSASQSPESMPGSFKAFTSQARIDQIGALLQETGFGFADLAEDVAQDQPISASMLIISNIALPSMACHSPSR